MQRNAQVVGELPDRIEYRVEVDHKWGFLGVEYGMSSDSVPAESVTETQTAYFVTLAGKTPWHVGPAVRYDAGDLEEFQRLTVGGYWGEPDARVRLFLDYEYFKDELGTHDARVETMLQVVF